MAFDFKVGFDVSQFESGTKKGEAAAERFRAAAVSDFKEVEAAGSKTFKKAREASGRFASATAKDANKAARAHEAGFNRARDASGRFTKAAVSNSRRSSAAFRRVGLSARSVGTSISSLVSGPLASLGLALGAGALASGFAKNALALEKAAAEVGTIVDETKVPLESLIAQGRELAATYGIDGVQATKSLYQTISAGIEPTKAVGFLADAAKLSTAGLGEMESTTKLLAGTLKAYGLGADKAAAVSDVLFTTVKDGVTNIPELAASFGKIGPLAASAGVSIQELGATVSTLTQSGLSTAESVTATRAAIQGFIKPTKEASEAAKSIGFDLSATGLASNGLEGSLDLLRAALGRADAAGEDTTAITAALFGSIEAGNAVLKLTSEDGAKKFTDSLGNARNSLGNTDKAVEKVNNTVGQKLKVALAFAKNEAGKLGAEFLTLLGDGIKLLGGIEGVKAAITGLRFAFSGTFKLIGAVVITTVNKVRNLIDGFVAGVKVAGNALTIIGQRAQQVKAALSFDFKAAAAFGAEAEKLGTQNRRLIDSFGRTARARSRQNELAGRRALADFSKANAAFGKVISGNLPTPAADVEERNSIDSDLGIDRAKAQEKAEIKAQREKQAALAAEQKAADEQFLKNQKAFDKMKAAEDKQAKAEQRELDRQFMNEQRQDEKEQNAFLKEQRRLQREDERALRAFEKEEAKRRGDTITNSASGVRRRLGDTLTDSFRQGIADAGPAFRSALRAQISGVVATIQFDSEQRGREVFRRQNSQLRASPFFNAGVGVRGQGSGIFGQLTAKEAFNQRLLGLPGFRNSGIVGGQGGADSQLVRATPNELFVEPNLTPIVAPIVSALKRSTPSDVSQLDRATAGVNIGEQNFNIQGGGNPESIASAIFEQMERAKTLGQEAL